jgi:hypothetical protein
MTLQQVTPQQLMELLTFAIPAKKNVLVVGSPGIGKSSITAQAAQQVDADIIISNPPVEDPTVPAGLPWPDANNGHAKFLPMGPTAQVLKATKLTVWNLEDFGQASAAVQAAYMQWLLAREVNGHKLPDCVTFVATSNKRTDRAGVSGILEPVKSRFATIVELVSNLDQWCQWALKNDIVPEVIAYLRFSPDSLNKFEATADMTNSPIERQWAKVSDWLKLQMPSAIEAAALAGAIGEGEAGQFLAFLKMYRELPSVDGIIMDPDNAKVPTDTSVLWAVATALAARANEKNFTNVARYAERLAEAGRGNFAALTIRDAMRRKPGLQQTPAFVELMVGELGALIGAANANA